MATKEKFEFEVEWIDGGREPTSKPNSNFPNGIDLDLTGGKRVMSCKIPLDYPAPRIGSYFIKCRTCETTALVTTAGRIDDPRSVRIPCKGRVR